MDRLSARARQAETEAALLFIVANDTFALLPYRAALVFTLSGDRARFACHSGLTSVDRRSTFGSFCEKAVETLLPRLQEGGVVSVLDVTEALRETWREYWPDAIQAYPLWGGGVAPLGVALYVCDAPWPEEATPMFSAMHQTYGLALQRLCDARHRFGFSRGSSSRGRRVARWAMLGAVAAGVLALALPVRQFVVAPAEIISLDAIAVTSPVEGVVAEVVAKPNQAVKKGDVLVELDDTAIRGRLESALQGLKVARAEYLAAAHRALMSSDRSTEVGVLRGRIDERLAEVAFLQEQLAMQKIRALRDGVAVYGQENDWIGKPVGAGHRIMELADPASLGVQVWVPVADAINLEAGARFSVLLHADPLRPLAALIDQASYQAVKSPDGIAAYRVRARLEGQGAALPRLGLRGNAKIDGEEVALGYFLLRRPIAVLRQWLGV